jgi:uncharacterized protein
MRLAVTGSTGFIGSALCAALRKAGHNVMRLVRPPDCNGPDRLRWDPLDADLQVERMEALDGVFHLAGEPISTGRWNVHRQILIRESRIGPTRLLAECIAALREKPRFLVSASAVGYYGNRGADILSEDAHAGTGFLAEVCRDWEAVAEPARAAGIRVVHPRLGMVLGPGGGALAMMTPTFRLGLGGHLGSGDQYMSWIALEDAVEALVSFATDERIAGPVNLTAPDPVTNRAFTQGLAAALHRPAMLPVPAPVLRLVLGRLADEVLLASARAVPTKLLDAGFLFRYPTMDGALRKAVATG